MWGSSLCEKGGLDEKQDKSVLAAQRYAVIKRRLLACEGEDKKVFTCLLKKFACCDVVTSGTTLKGL
jgi:hypothetical protein